MTTLLLATARASQIKRTPLGRPAAPIEIASTALFLASEDGSFYTGQWLSPNGGMFIG